MYNDGMELTDKEKAVLRSIGKKAYSAMVETVGEKKLKAIAKKQGKEHAKLAKEARAKGLKPGDKDWPEHVGGRPPLYPDCPHRPATSKTKSRHRFVNGKCSCGQVKLT